MIKNNLKICLVASVDITVKFLLLSQIKFFQEKGCDVHVVCSPGKLLKDIETQGIKIRTITIKRKIFAPISDIVSLFRLFFYFKKEKFDIVFTFTPKPGFLGQISAKLAGVPIILNTIFGFYFHENTPYLKRKFFIFIEKIAGKCSSFVFFRNIEDFKTAQKEKIITQGKAEFIGDGIDISKFDSKRFSLDFIKNKKEKLGIDQNVFVVGIVARLVKEKGYLELFSAFKKVIEKFPKTLLLVIGSADTKKFDSIEISIVKDFDIEKNILFLGERNDIDEIYSVMNAFVLPSYREGFSHSIMEASAMSLPIITSDVRGCRGAVDNGVTGILVPAKDSEKLAEAIVHFLENPEKIKHMGIFGRQKAQREFDERIVFGRIKKEYDRLIELKLNKK